MDPFAALSLAGTVVQFVELGIKITTKGTEIWRSKDGQTNINQQRSTIIGDLWTYSKDLNKSLADCQSMTERDIGHLASKCAEDAEKLRKLLSEVKFPERKKNGSARQEKERLRILLTALRSLWKEEEIRDMNERLVDYRGQLTLRLVGLLNDKTSASHQLLETLVESTSVTNLETITQLREIRNAIHDLKSMQNQLPVSRGTVASTKAIDIPLKLEQMTRLGDEAIQLILKSLYYSAMHSREFNVFTAHAETFEWLFKTQSSFSKWLSTSGGIFWITGKPGSGKSTLMKFVSRHEQTKEILKAWAGDQILIVANFYFWNSGDPIQKSLQGLLQSLLYEILKQCRLLIPVIAPRRWASTFSSDMETGWTIQDVVEALERFIVQDTVPCRTGIFIDGLDEFEGDDSKLMDLLERMSSSNNIKLCLASRPENRFRSAYGRNPDRMLQIHDSTKDDIYRYASDKLGIELDIDLTPESRIEKADLLNEIVNRANGVFLWVFLVVRSLREAFTNDDPIWKKRRRLETLPVDLEQYFDHILDSIKHEYWEDAAKVFRMAPIAVYSFPIGVFSIFDQENEDFCLRQDLRPTNLVRYDKAIESLQKRLAARTNGLLEMAVTPGHRDGAEDYYARDIVVFLHRTVRDFLEGEEVQSKLKSRFKEPYYPDLALCKGFLIHLKQFIPTDQPLICRRMSAIKALEDLIYHARRVEILTKQTPTDILDQAHHVVTTTKDFQISDEKFYDLVVQHGLVIYMRQKLDLGLEIPSITSEPPLGRALFCSASSRTRERYYPAWNVEMIQLLLSEPSKADPNDYRGHSGRTIWSSFVDNLASRDHRQKQQFKEVLYDICVVMLQADAQRYDGLREKFNRFFDAPEARLLSNRIQELDLEHGPHEIRTMLRDNDVRVLFNCYDKLPGKEEEEERN